MHGLAVCPRAWGVAFVSVTLWTCVASAQENVSTLGEESVQHGDGEDADVDSRLATQSEDEAMGDQDEGEKLFEAIEACPPDWQSYFTEEALVMLPGAVVARNLAARTSAEQVHRKKGKSLLKWLRQSQVRLRRSIERKVDGLFADMSATNIPRHLQEKKTSSTSTTTTTTTITTITTTWTTTGTSTTLTMTTTDLFPCSICPLYHYLCPGDCTNCVAAGECRVVWQKSKDFNPTCDHRRTLDDEDACVDFGHVEMACPADSYAPGRLVDVVEGSFPLIRCRVCGFGPLPPDSSMYRGVWRGELTWGPNQFEAQIGETNIEAYHVHIVDQRLRKLTDLPLEIVKAKLWANLFNSSYCDVKLYKASVRAILPDGAAFFMVVPLTREGLEMKIGVTSSAIVDLGTLMLSNGMRFAVLSRASWWLLCFQALLVLTTGALSHG